MIFFIFYLLLNFGMYENLGCFLIFQMSFIFKILERNINIVWLSNVVYGVYVDINILC